MLNRKWLKIIGILELMVLAVIFAIFLILFAMGMTAYKEHESAVVMQFLGLALLIIIPLILLI